MSHYQMIHGRLVTQLNGVIATCRDLGAQGGLTMEQIAALAKLWASLEEATRLVAACEERSE